MAGPAKPRVNNIRKQGEHFWYRHSTFGRQPIFADPDDLWQAACEYFDYVAQNPLKEDKVFNTKSGAIRHESISLMRAMTGEGMRLFLDINLGTWQALAAKPEYADVVARINSVIRSQKFEGAAAGLLNAAIVIRDLGLTDNSSSTTTINKGSGWQEVFERIGDKSRALEHQGDLIEALPADDTAKEAVPVPPELLPDNS